MAIEARTEVQTPKTATRVVVTEINPGMILQDLAMGLDKQAIADKYSYQDPAGNVQDIELWMVEEMFKDPLLKGKRPAKVKKLPFRFLTSDPTCGIKDVTFDPTQVVADDAPVVTEPFATTTVETTVEEAQVEVDVDAQASQEEFEAGVNAEAEAMFNSNDPGL
jgi:hypothetical protein